MEGRVGTLKVLVVRGKRLAIRDFKSSDPYVIVKLGNQTQKTKVINSCLNPVWNEELVFSVSEPVGVLQLEVFDRDRFKSDDKMGRAQVSLQDLVSGARLSRALRLSTGETKLRKVAPDGENRLMAESFVTFVAGEIVQEVRLKLSDVESGELELKLHWSENPTSQTTGGAAGA
ncbi:unnamed protein product [Spirodela intermedia]|uniref:C2 domain-containing protein n=1 Tax=Spirodela intermedia TaxID=51605 RepID=A0A7I8JKI9_SPIIN|nr:unnamed protein product [Spirodela intermedia]CAA6670697.1 unnamed protein product [Spirodela intermedia]